MSDQDRKHWHAYRDIDRYFVDHDVGSDHHARFGVHFHDMTHSVPSDGDTSEAQQYADAYADGLLLVDAIIGDTE